MRVCFLLLVVGNIYVWHYTTTRADSYHHIYFLDVGQGDSIFIRTAADFRILIDAGTTNSAASELGRILPAWDRQIDLVIATHPHADHIGGLADVIDQYRVDKFWWNGAAYESQTHATLLADLAAANIPTEVASHQTLLPLPDPNSTLKVLHPQTRLAASDINESSVVAHLRLDQFDLWLSGDAGAPTEELLLTNGALADVDVLKVGHHGSRTATTGAFLQALAPEVGVIMVGADNRYGHPHPEILDRLTAAQVEIHRTDQSGTIEITTDGRHYQVR